MEGREGRGWEQRGDDGKEKGGRNVELHHYF